MLKISFEGPKTITLSVGGHIKLWEQSTMLFHLKLPDLKKLTWNLEKIENIRT
jgi:hypothetical protein